jgi:hypothetical protein
MTVVVLYSQPLPQTLTHLKPNLQRPQPRSQQWEPTRTTYSALWAMVRTCWDVHNKERKRAGASWLVERRVMGLILFAPLSCMTHPSSTSLTIRSSLTFPNTPLGVHSYVHLQTWPLQKSMSLLLTSPRILPLLPPKLGTRAEVASFRERAIVKLVYSIDFNERKITQVRASLLCGFVFSCTVFHHHSHCACCQVHYSRH